MIKGMALVDYILDYFVVLGAPVSTVGNSECGFVCNVYAPTMAPCGQALLDNILAVTFGVVELLPTLLCALFAQA